MVRTYRRRLGTRQYKNYSSVKLEKALEEIVNGGISIKQASAKYKIPYGTLFNKFHGRHSRNAGGQTVLSFNEEKVLIDAILRCADWGYPLTMTDLRKFTKSYLDQLGRVIPKFNDNLPGIDWARSLLNRHKSEASQRLASNISRKRAQVSVKDMRDYLKNLKTTLDGVPVTNIFNYDETNMSDDPGKTRNIFRRGTKYPEKVVNHSKSATTVMFCASASGVLLPPYVIFKAEHLWNTWTTEEIDICEK